MKSNRLENKIKKVTKNKEYDKAKEKILKYYTKHFKKMLKYKNVKIDKKWYMYDYLIHVKDAYESLFSKDIDELIDLLYSEKYGVKQQIEWLIENCEIFNFYKF